MVVVARTVSVADFMAMPDDGNRHELVRGDVRSMPPPKGQHGVLEFFISEEIGRYLREHALALGWQPEQGLAARTSMVGFAACGEFGMQFAVPDDPHQIRGADCVYVPAEQLAQVAWDDYSYFPAVPWLVIEVISASDTAADVAERVRDYLAGGARRIWCVYPEQRSIHIYTAGGKIQMLSASDTVIDEELLPGFSLPIAWLF